MGYGSFHTHTRTRTHIHKYINMQPVPLSACSHQQRGHRRLKKQQMRLESEAPWRTCSGRVEDEKSKKEKEKKKKRGRRNLSIHFTDQSERGRVSGSHHAGRGEGVGRARHLRAGEG